MATIFDSILSGLSKSAAGAFSALRSLSETDLRPTQILAQLRSQGASIRTQTGLDLIALLRNKADTDRFFRTFGPNAPLPAVMHTFGPIQFNKGARFQYTVGTNSTNPIVREAIYVNSATPLSENEIFAVAAAAFKYEEITGMAASQLSDVFFTVDDARRESGG